MAAIKGKNTKPELWLRKELFRLGFRYRLHRKDLPGKPDIVFPRLRTVIFVNGCFWHCHEGCPLFKLPGTNPEFWQSKLRGNRERDIRNYAQLAKQNWRVIVVWECSMKGKGRIPTDELLGIVERLIRSDSDHFSEVTGTIPLADKNHR
ncbi:MAG: very short patch repair endonuclease [Pseudomonadales bacterium]|nr:very short patch repair endonuclease [Pseudomonadales bacterium]